jgi:alanyl-tRNA synthetase
VYDREKARDPRTAAVLLGTGDKVQVLVAFTPALAKGGSDARKVFAEGTAAIEGRGGGRPEMVRGSGAKAAGAAEALEKMVAKAREMLG